MDWGYFIVTLLFLSFMAFQQIMRERRREAVREAVDNINETFKKVDKRLDDLDQAFELYERYRKAEDEETRQLIRDEAKIIREKYEEKVIK